MSGAEVIAVLGVISSIIAIVDGTKKVYDAAKNLQGLPEAFREVAGRLSIVENTLDSTRQNIKERTVNNDSCKGVKHIVEACEEKAKKLEELFQKAIPSDDVSDLKRYYKAVIAWGKGSEVENLMKGMLEDLQLLTCESGMKTATKVQQEQIIKAIAEVSAVSPSVPEHEFQEPGFTNSNCGSGTQYNARGENIAQGNAQQYMSSGTMNFGQTNFDITTQSFSVSLGPNEDEAQACLRVLFVTDISADRAKLTTIKGPRVDGTCEWIKSHPLYDSWFRSQSQLLWLSGGPGKGKTMLSIFLAEELEHTVRLSQNKLFLQYFCDNKDEKRNSAVNIIKGLIYQLLQSRRKLFNHILPTFRTQKESFKSSFETVWWIFESMVCDPALETAYCVLDGLDECDEASLEILLGKFAALLSAKTDKSSACHLKLLIVSRAFPDFIPELLSSFPRIALDPDADTEINQDVDLFIKVKVEELSRRKQYPKTLRLHVEEVFRERAQGTFLWIGIVAQALRKYKATEVQEALDLFPKGLDELYARILLQIDSDRRDIAARILRWVVMAVRPLTLSELSIATETTAERSIVAFNRDERIGDQVSNCGHFLQIEKGVVGLIHQSAKDYLLRKTRDSNPELEFFRVKEEVANLEIARTCLQYLHSGALENSKYGDHILENTDRLRAFPLLNYAALHWHEHARLLTRSGDIFDLSLPFYQKNSPIRKSWLMAYRDYIFHESGRSLFPSISSPLLHLASCFGILPLAENLILGKGLWNKTKSFYSLRRHDFHRMTALNWAVREGHEAVVRLLVEMGANINAKNEYGETALIQAVQGGWEAVVRVLLEKGADINAKTRYGLTTLSEAVKQGSEAVVRLLLEKGADINAKSRYGETTLLQAVKLGREAFVRLLLEKGADIEAATSSEQIALSRRLIALSSGQRALMMAAIYGRQSTVRLLIENGADINAKTGDGETALMEAADIGSDSLFQNGELEAVMQILLEKGADIEVQDIRGRRALMKAAKEGWVAGVQLLLEKGADINAQDKGGETALMEAASFGSDSSRRGRELEAVMQILLEKGAGIEVQEIRGRRALMKAAKKGWVTGVQLLLEKGADINAQDKGGETALMEAASLGSDSSLHGRELEAVMQILLEKGADFEVQDIRGRRALMKAAEKGWVTGVQLLLEKGADINAQDKGGETALMMWIVRGFSSYESTDCEPVVKLLLEKGADVNVKDKNGKTALMKVAKWKSRRDDESMVRLLLETGADIQAQDNKRQTALIKAKKRKNKAVVQLLTSAANS